MLSVALASTIPSLVLSFLTAPYVRQIHLQIPPSATHSLAALRGFARTIPAATKITFQTLRIIPFAKETSCYLFELRALPQRRFRFANLEIPKTAAWRKRQSEKSLWWRFKDFVGEPRFKFFVKEGKAYTVRSGVPGVWEEVAKKIQEQTVKEGMKGLKKESAVVLTKRVKPSKVIMNEEKPKALRRQTSRPPLK